MCFTFSRHKTTLLDIFPSRNGFDRKPSVDVCGGYSDHAPTVEKPDSVAVHDSSSGVETPMEDGISTCWMFEPWIEFKNNNQSLFES